MKSFGQNYRLLNVNLVDPGKEEALPGQYLVVKDGLIEARGSMETLVSARGMEDVDLSGRYVMPGLIDAHVHLAGGRGSIVYGETEVLAEPKAVRSMRSVYEAQKLLKHGFTSVRDISWNGLYLKRIFGDGIMAGPRIIACGPGLTRTGGHADIFQFTEEYVKQQHFWGVLADGCEEVRKWARRVLREGADQVKIWASGGGNWENDRSEDLHYTFEEIKTCVEEAHMIKGTYVCAHAENLESIKLCLKAGVDTIEHGEDLDEEACTFMKEHGIILVPTMGLLVNWYRDFVVDSHDGGKIRPEIYLNRHVRSKDETKLQQQEKEAICASFSLALEKGVKIALGSDTIYEPLTEYGRYSLNEYKTLIECGMTIPQAIEAATANSAAALNMQERIGTLEVGKEADLLVLKENPLCSAEVLCNPENLQFVIIGGRLAVEEGRLVF